MNDNARGRDIIAQILVNMRGQTEELRYSRVVASSYNVHLHPDDYARLEGLVPEIVLQARRALGEELERLNRAAPLEERVRSLVRKPKVPYERTSSEWAIQIIPDPNDELQPGDILVDATLVTPGTDGYAGSRTQRIVTHRHGEQVERRVGPAETVPAAPPAAAPFAAPPSNAAMPTFATPPAATPPLAATQPFAATSSLPAPAPAEAPRDARADDGRPALAIIRWRDNQGAHAFRMVTPSIKVGRGGASYWVDIKLDAAADVSREHLRIRYDEAARQFFVQDLSTYGTTVNGVALPKPPADAAPGTAAPETPLPARAMIGLADVLVMSFDSEIETQVQPEAQAAEAPSAQSVTARAPGPQAETPKP